MTSNSIITRQQLRAWGACYTDKRIAELVPPEGLTLVQVLELESVSWLDRLWVLSHARPASAERLAVWSAGLALRHWDARYPDDRRVRDALRVTSSYLRGKATEDQVRAARADAYAAYTSARAAADACAAYAAADAAYAANAAYAADAAAYAYDAYDAAYAARVAADAYAADAADAAARTRARIMRRAVEMVRRDSE